jgi:hypothetical protein
MTDIDAHQNDGRADGSTVTAVITPDPGRPLAAGDIPPAAHEDNTGAGGPGKTDHEPCQTAADPRSAGRSRNSIDARVSDLGWQLVRWVIFWFAVFGWLGWLVTHAEDWLYSPQQLTISVAIFSTAFFAHFSILLPFLRPRFGIVRCAPVVFGFIVLVGFVSLALGMYYLDIAIHFADKKSIWFNIESMKTFIAKTWLLNTLVIPMAWFGKIHTAVYAVIFFLTDLLIAIYAVPRWLREEFSRVAWYIDFPLIIGIGYANFIHLWIADDANAFLAGAVSLQLFVANIALLVFKCYDYLTLRAEQEIAAGASSIRQTAVARNASQWGILVSGNSLDLTARIRDWIGRFTARIRDWIGSFRGKVLKATGE